MIIAVVASLVSDIADLPPLGILALLLLWFFLGMATALLFGVAARRDDEPWLPRDRRHWRAGDHQ